jgi:hypothetical protein
MLFDFNVSARINAPFDPRLEGTNFDEHRNDVKGVIFTLYEIITRDQHFRNVEPSMQNVFSVLNIDWVKHPDIRLDKPLGTYRDVLNAWVQRRKENENITDKSSFINWPDLPKPPRESMEGREARANNIQVVEWKRPAQEKIKEGMSVFADGTVTKTARKA